MRVVGCSMSSILYTINQNFFSSRGIELLSYIIIIRDAGFSATTLPFFKWKTIQIVGKHEFWNYFLKRQCALIAIKILKFCLQTSGRYQRDKTQLFFLKSFLFSPTSCQRSRGNFLQTIPPGVPAGVNINLFSGI